MTFFKAYKKAKQILKEEAELRKNLRAIRRADLSYECLSKLIENVANSVSGVTLDVVFSDGTKMTIRQSTRSEINFQSFQDQWNEKHNRN